jgi:hypothetical protein
MARRETKKRAKARSRKEASLRRRWGIHRRR